MSGYLLGVVGTVLLSAIITAIMPEGKVSGAVKGVTRLVCIIAIISPILRFFKTGEMDSILDKNSGDFFSESVIETDTAVIQYYSEMRIAETERALQAMIQKEYGIDAQVTLVCDVEKENFWELYDAERIRVRQIKIRLKEKSEEEVLRRMWSDLSKNYCSEVLIE